MNLTVEDKLLMAICVYHEARGEPMEGQVAVAQIILNRAQSRRQTIREVVFAPYQFSWANGGARPPIADYEALIRAAKAVALAIARRATGDNMESADHYFADYIETPKWAKTMVFIKKIGKHLFYRDK